MSQKTDLSFALGLAIKTLGLNPTQLNDEQISELQFLAQDALLEDPKTKAGKKLKFDLIREKANPGNSEYSKNFAFGQDLTDNKVKPSSVFLAKIISENIQEYIDGDKDKNIELIDKMSNEIIVMLNGLNYPIDYLDNFFKNVANLTSQVKDNVKGQVDARKDQILSFAIGVKHPTFDTLDNRVVSFKDLDASIEKLKAAGNYTEEDYRK